MSGDLVVLHEDPAFVVVEKPAGVHTAPLHPGETGTLLEAVIARYADVASAPGIKDVEPGLIHRLDRETSGVVVIARSAEAFAALRRAFAEGRARKGYCAACEVQTDERSFRIESRFAPRGPGRRMVRVVPEGAPRNATRQVYRTEAEVTCTRPGRALVRASLTRGFRHQVRAHLSFLGLPIFGDPLYGAPVPPGTEQRMYLHAERIELPHPTTGAPLIITSPVPRCFSALVEGGSP